MLGCVLYDSMYECMRNVSKLVSELPGFKIFAPDR